MGSDLHSFKSIFQNKCEGVFSYENPSKYAQSGRAVPQPICASSLYTSPTSDRKPANPPRPRPYRNRPPGPLRGPDKYATQSSPSLAGPPIFYRPISNPHRLSKGPSSRTMRTRRGRTNKSKTSLRRRPQRKRRRRKRRPRDFDHRFFFAPRLAFGFLIPTFPAALPSSASARLRTNRKRASRHSGALYPAAPTTEYRNATDSILSWA